MSGDEGHKLREHDLDDLMAEWHKSIDTLKLVWCKENADKAKKAFDAVLDYIHAGEVPETDDPNGRLLTVTSIVCPRCHTTYSRAALERLSGKCLVCGHKEVTP